MKKNVVYALTLIGLVVLITISILLFRDYSKKDNAWTSKWSHSITVTEGKVDSERSECDFSIKKAGDYSLSFSWMPAGYDQKEADKHPGDHPGFVTLLLLFDDAGDMVFSTTGSALTANPTLALSAGTYHAEFHYMTALGQFEEYASKYLCGTYRVPYLSAGQKEIFDGLSKNGTWRMEYSLDVFSVSENRLLVMITLFCGILVGICLIFLFLALISKGNRLSSPKYDERQEMERGRGFKYAFFSMLIFLCTLCMFNSGGFFSSEDFTLLTGVALFLGINVYVVYCIWHEAYFALNQKTTYVMILFFLIGLFNLGISIAAYFSGELIQNGKFGLNVLNLLSALTFLEIFVTMLLKRWAMAKAEDKMDEEDEA